ncbi:MULTISPECIES: CHASE4 domain-containing protein [Methanobacterium]|uniref:histidine kinase n=1 Tax=Methanobacterium veterum TaxID=408577 RepID=A0A9E5A6R2_9EURY|nr:MULTISPECIES: CHASE4 domain-containing protein [Methanobacterium]MCZ3367311.1 PAS domain S-box protein [Methanobacterium veterum]MCZ3373541.1 PAS domain S-box protein [Methanobacterium veterum]
MKLREKTLVLLGITITCSIIVMCMASNVVLMGGFQTLEEQNTLQNIQLATNVLSGEISDLNKTINDWAVWDDTYIFIQNHNSRYIQSNLLNSTFTGLKLNLIIYVDNSGNIVYGKEFDLQKKEEKPVSEGIKKYISKDNILLSSQDGVKGIIMLPEGPMIIVSHPILTSNGDGPSKGTLIFGRYLSDVEIQHLSGEIQSSLTLISYNDFNIPADFQTARESMSQSSPFFIKPINDSYIAGYALINDIDGKPAFILKTERPRGFYKEYQNTLSYFITSLLIICCFLAVITLIYLDRSILSKLSRFSKDISIIGKKGDLSTRILADGEDELSSLAESINGMLSRIETSQDQLKKSELEFRSLVELANNSIVLTDSAGKIMLWNRSAQRMFGYSENEILGKPISILFPDEYHESYQKVMDNPYNSANSQNMGVIYESYGFKKDKSRFMLEISHISWKIKNEKFYCAIIRDITDSKQAENEIKESLREKEALLMEIHHRVKNNMQIISSLLSLQSRYIKDKDAFEVFKESQNRVKSMAMIHERLYNSKGLAKIDFAGYIKNLVDDLFGSYGVNQDDIKIDISADKIFLNADTAIPVGLIINELVTNSLKYAFPAENSDHEKSRIYIKFHRNNKNMLLVVGDNGIGLPEDVDLQHSETLGLRLVRSLVDQINGTVELHSNGQTEFRIIFTQIEQNSPVTS